MKLTVKQEYLLLEVASGHPYVWDDGDIRVARNLVAKGLIAAEHCFTKVRLTDAGASLAKELA